MELDIRTFLPDDKVFKASYIEGDVFYTTTSVYGFDEVAPEDSARKGERFLIALENPKKEFPADTDPRDVFSALYVRQRNRQRISKNLLPYANHLMAFLLQSKMPLTDKEVFCLLCWLVYSEVWGDIWQGSIPVFEILQRVAESKKSTPTLPWDFALARLNQSPSWERLAEVNEALIKDKPLPDSAFKPLIGRLQRLAAVKKTVGAEGLDRFARYFSEEIPLSLTYEIYPISKMSGSSQRVAAFLNHLSTEWIQTVYLRDAENWQALFEFFSKADDVSPKKPLVKELKAKINVLGEALVKEALIHLLTTVNQAKMDCDLHDRGHPRKEIIHGKWEVTDWMESMLIGFCWASTVFSDKALAVELRQLAQAMYQSATFNQPRNKDVADAALHALMQMDGTLGLEQIALFRSSTKDKKTLSGINKVWQKAVKKTGLSDDILSELVVSDFGMTEKGTVTEEVGDFLAVIKPNDEGRFTLFWHSKHTDSTQSKTPPAIKQNHEQQLKSLQKLVKELEFAKKAQANRLESTYLKNAEWPTQLWVKNYIHHPFLSSIGAQLVWDFQSEQGWTSGIIQANEVLDRNGNSMPLQTVTAVRLWHPARCPEGDVVHWSQTLNTSATKQPFAQIERKVICLEHVSKKSTNTIQMFSGMRIHQQKAKIVAANYGWTYHLAGKHDDYDDYPLEKVLAAWSLKATLKATVDCESETTLHDVFTCAEIGELSFTKDGNEVPLPWVPGMVFSEVLRELELILAAVSLSE